MHLQHTQLSCFIYLTATNITIDTEGLLTAESGGYAPGKGPGQGIGHDTGSSGGSHGGTGGRGSSTTYAGLAYDSIRRPRRLGSGGGTTRSVTNGFGGGAIFLKASKYVEIDGELQANGGTGSDTAAGGGAGGSIVIETEDFLGKHRPLVKSVLPKVNFYLCHFSESRSSSGSTPSVRPSVHLSVHLLVCSSVSPSVRNIFGLPCLCNL